MIYTYIIYGLIILSVIYLYYAIWREFQKELDRDLESAKILIAITDVYKEVKSQSLKDQKLILDAHEKAVKMLVENTKILNDMAKTYRMNMNSIINFENEQRVHKNLSTHCNICDCVLTPQEIYTSNNLCQMCKNK